MPLKEDWKKMGKDVGHAFKDFGKAVATTAKVAVGKEDNSQVNEDGKTPLREAWSDTGKQFGEAGKSIGRASKNTAKKVVGKEDKQEKPSKPKEEDVIDVESKEK